VADGENAGRARHGGDGGQVHQVHARVGGRLDPDGARGGAHCGAHRRFVAQIHVFDLDAALRQQGEQAVGAAVQIVMDDEVLAGLEQHQQGGFGGHAGAEDESGGAVLQRGEAGFQGFARGVAAPRIVVGARTADALEGERGGLVDRRHHRAERRVGRLSGVHRKSFESLHE
jgi:hypothetical protein